MNMQYDDYDDYEEFEPSPSHLMRIARVEAYNNVMNFNDEVQEVDLGRYRATLDRDWYQALEVEQRNLAQKEIERGRSPGASEFDKYVASTIDISGDGVEVTPDDDRVDPQLMRLAFALAAAELADKAHNDLESKLERMDMGGDDDRYEEHMTAAMSLRVLRDAYVETAMKTAGSRPESQEMMKLSGFQRLSELHDGLRDKDWDRMAVKLPNLDMPQIRDAKVRRQAGGSGMSLNDKETKDALPPGVSLKSSGYGSRRS